MVHAREVTTKFNYIQVDNHLYVHYKFKKRCSSMFHIFSEIVLLFFDFLVTGGTYDNQTWTKMFRKNLKNILCATFQKWSWL